MNTIAVICICLAVVAAVQAAPQNGKKVTFSTDTSIDYSEIEVKDAAFEPGSPEYYEAHRMVHVTPDGYEYTEPLESVMKYMKEVWNQDIPSHPKDIPSQPHPSEKATIDDIKPTGPDQDLSDIMDAFKNVVAEKRSVIGADTRYLVKPTRFPYTAIGRVNLGCTGTFVARHTVLTSGHCVYKTRTNQWYGGTNMNILRGKDCDPDCGTQHVWKRLVTFVGYATYHNYRYDMGLILVTTPSPVQMPFTSAPNIPLEIINMAGYPGDKSGRCLYATYCTLAFVDAFILQYPCDTAGGMSGSGVYKYCSRSNTRIIYGVHGYGVALRHKGRDNMNSAVRVTASFERALRGAMAQYGGN